MMDEVSMEDLDWDAIENGEQKRLHARVNGEAHVGGLHKETSVGNVSLAGPKIIRGDHQTATEAEMRKRADHRRNITRAHDDLNSQQEDVDGQDEGELRENLVQVVHRLRTELEHTGEVGSMGGGKKHAAKRREEWERLMRV